MGAGTMGSGIAQLFATYGHQVSLYNRTRIRLDKALSQIKSNLEKMAELDEIPAESTAGILANIHVTDDLQEAVKEADLIIENVAEQENVKRQILTEIDRFCGDEAIIASDTSTMDIFQFAKVRHMDRLCVAHFFLPAYVIPLIELIRGPETSDETVKQVKTLLESVGKEVAVLNKVIPGFIVNRVTLAIFREVNYIASLGVASPADIDKALVSVYGPRFAFEGPFGLCDFAGADLYERLSDELLPEISDSHECPSNIRKLVRAGKLGLKSGSGFYRHENAADEISRRNAKIIKMIQAIRKTNTMFEQT